MQEVFSLASARSVRASSADLATLRLTFAPNEKKTSGTQGTEEVQCKGGEGESKLKEWHKFIGLVYTATLKHRIRIQNQELLKLRIATEKVHFKKWIVF